MANNLMELWEQAAPVETDLDSLWEQAAPVKQPSSDRNDFATAGKRGIVGMKKQAGNVLKFIAADARQRQTDFEQRFKPPEGFPKTSFLKPDELESIGTRLTTSAQQTLDSPDLQLSEEVRSKPWYAPKRLALTTIEAAPTTVAGVGAGIVAGAVTKNPFIGAGITGAAFGALSAGEIYDEATKAGMGAKEALKAAKIAGAGEAALEFIPGYMFLRLLKIGKPLSKTALKEGVKELSRIRKIAKGIGTIALAEGIEEGLQTAKDNLIAKHYYEPERKIGRGVAESMAVGSIMGSVLGGGGAIATSGKGTVGDTGLDFSKLETETDLEAMFEEVSPVEESVAPATAAVVETDLDTLWAEATPTTVVEEGVVTDTQKLQRGVDEIQQEQTGQASLLKNKIVEEGKGTGEAFKPATTAQVKEVSKFRKVEAISGNPIDVEGLVATARQNNVSEEKITEMLSQVPKAKKDILNVKPGESVEIDVFHGTGREKGKGYTETYSGINVLGDGKYSAIDEKVAKTYGPKVVKDTIKLKNPYIIDSDNDLRDLFGADIPYDNKPRIPLLKKARKKIEDAGHDGVIINIPQFDDVNAKDELVKRIREIFGDSQVLVFKPATTAQVKERVDADTGSKDITLEILGFQSIYEALAELARKGKASKGIDSLVNLADKVYTGGGFKSFVHDMKLALGNLWKHYKGMIGNIWNHINKRTKSRIKQVADYEKVTGNKLSDEQLNNIGMSDADVKAYRNTPQATPASELQNKAIRKIVEFFSPFSTVPGGFKYKLERWESLGAAARVERIVGKVVKKTKGFSKQMNKDMFKFLDGKLELSELPQEIRHTALQLQTLNRRIGAMLVKRGLIKKEAWEKHKNQYIRYVYLKYMLDDPDISAGGGKINTAALKARIDPVIKSRQAGKEYVDKTIYEGLLEIAKTLGIHHDRVLNAGRNKLGVASPGGGITTQFATELSVLAHEIGHQLDFKYGLWDLIVKSTVGIGKKGEVTRAASSKARGVIQSELRTLADLTWEGVETTPHFKKKVRKKAEKMAHMLEAYIHANERFIEVAPTVYNKFDEFVRSMPELENLSKLKQGLVLKGVSLIVYRVESASGRRKYGNNITTLKEAEKIKENAQAEVDKYRESIGLIEDVSVAEPIGVALGLKNVIAYDKLIKISENPDWVWTPSVIEADGSKWGIDALGQEVEQQAVMIANNPDSVEMRERYNRLNNAYQAALEENNNKPDDFISLPSSASFGKLAGMAVRKEIYKDLMPIFSKFSDSNTISKSLNAIIKIETQGMQLFKIGKVTVNPPTMFRNVVSGMIQLNWSGIPLYDIPGYGIKAISSMIAKDANYTRAFRSGLFRTNMAESELREIHETFKKMNGNSWLDIVGHATKLSKFYGKIEDVFKLAKYTEQIETGNSHEIAISESQKWGMDYSLAPHVVKYLRRHLIPFATYSYKITSLMSEAMVKRPWSVLKYMAIPAIMTAWVRSVFDLSDEEWKKLERKLPFFIRRSDTQVPLPVKTDEGGLQWVNLEWFFPGQMWLSLSRNIADKNYWEATRDIGMGNPFLDIYSMMKSGRGGNIPIDPFSGIPLYNEFDSGTLKAVKTAEWFYNLWTPSILTRFGTLGKILDIGEKNRYGQVGTIGKAVSSIFGLNIISPTEDQGIVEKRFRLNKLKGQIYRKLEDTKTDKERDALLMEYQKRYENILEGKE